jgi:hypothetical protein
MTEKEAKDLKPTDTLVDDEGIEFEVIDNILTSDAEENAEFFFLVDKYYKPHSKTKKFTYWSNKFKCLIGFVFGKKENTRNYIILKPKVPVIGNPIGRILSSSGTAWAKENFSQYTVVNNSACKHEFIPLFTGKCCRYCGTEE